MWSKPDVGQQDLNHILCLGVLAFSNLELARVERQSEFELPDYGLNLDSLRS